MSQKRFFRSGELAAMFGISPDTLRHYERMRLLPPPVRSANGYREYSEVSIERIRLIRAAMQVGFTIRELSRILKVRDQGGMPCAEVRNLATAKLQTLDLKLEELKRMRSTLQKITLEWNSRLALTPAGHRAGLLETLTSGNSNQSKRRKNKS